MSAELLPHAVPLLADERVMREVLRSVCKMASTGAGQLANALLDPMQHPLVKQRLPLILAQSHSQLAVHGLTSGLDDPDWNVRLRCAKALNIIRQHHPQLEASEERVLGIIEREARALSDANDTFPVGATSAVNLGVREDASRRRIQLLFLLFGAMYEPETLELCHLALQSKDRDLQGTALEYLENLLPADIWVLLRPVLGPENVQTRTIRPLQHVVRDLLLAASFLRSEHTPEDTDSVPADEVDEGVGSSSKKPAKFNKLDEL